jgi:CRP/FNR family transcriptional regulator, cyclic AMP receptor protein
MPRGARTLLAAAPAMPSSPDMLALSASLPEVAFAVGDVVVREGGADGALWVLVSGALRVSKSGIVVNTVTRPGALIGEVAVLLDVPHGATVEATAPSVLRRAADGAALLAANSGVTRLVAIGLAERLNVVTTYLADLKHQYGDAPGIAMVTDVLAQLAARQAPPARPGSARDPDPPR